MANAHLRLVPANATDDVDLLELVGKQYATDPAFVLQWVARDPKNIAVFEATGWERVQESGIDVEVMGMLLMKKDRAAVEAEQHATRDKGEKNWTDAVECFGAMGGTVKSTLEPGDKR